MYLVWLILSFFYYAIKSISYFSPASSSTFETEDALNCYYFLIVLVKGAYSGLSFINEIVASVLWVFNASGFDID